MASKRAEMEGKHGSKENEKLQKWVEITTCVQMSTVSGQLTNSLTETL